MKKMVQGFAMMASLLILLASCSGQDASSASNEAAVADSLSNALDKAAEVKDMVEKSGDEIDDLLEGI